MVFVAEYISKEDIEKYGVIDIVNSSRANFGELPLGDQRIEQLDWVIDRQRDIWFIFVCDPHLPDPRDGFTGEEIYILCYKGNVIELDIRRIYDETTSKMLVDNPFFIKYKLENINSSIDGILLDELYGVLNEALKEYGSRGIGGRKFLPKEHQIVTFLHD